MRKKHASLILWSVAILVLMLLAVGFFLVIKNYISGKKKIIVKSQLDQYSSYMNIEEFRKIPMMKGENIQYGYAADYGNKHYVVDVEGVTVKDYLSYLDMLEANHFIKYSDNGENSTDGVVLCASFKKDNVALNVSHVINREITYISVTTGLELSGHLRYSETYLGDVKSDAKTKFHNLELNNNGNGFIYELKNGHFVIFDGGSSRDTPYFWDYLQSLVSKGEKPIVEAWFISHAHDDHYGVLLDFASNSKYKNNIIIDGIYFCEPTDEFVANTNYSEKGEMLRLKLVHTMFKAQNGNKCGYYRPQLGQRYYFCDIFIDVCLTPEQFTLDDYIGEDFNDTSIWLMVNIEGQKMLVAGDTNHTGMQIAMEMYDKDYFEMDIYVAFHHGINVYNYWSDYISFETLIYPSFRDGSIHDPNGKYAYIKENEYLQSKAKECYSWKKGTVILEFPYNVGEAITLEPCDWKYNENCKPVRKYGDAWSRCE